jgi:two-component system cell cycle sensor histidine kinase/response regulator CckA
VKEVAPEKRGPSVIDPFVAGAAALFLIAVAAAALPAVRAAPGVGPGLLLLLGLGGVAIMGLFAFTATETKTGGEPSAEDLIATLDEPAALASADGRIIACNVAWLDCGGGVTRLPAGAAAPALYIAFADARKGETGRACVRLGEDDHEMSVSPVGPDRYLVRAAPMPVEQPLMLPDLTEAAPPVAAEEAWSNLRLPSAPETLDSFAAAAPFGAALLDGEDPFASTVIEGNPGLAALTGGRGQPGVGFAELLDPQSLLEARQRHAAGDRPPYEVKLAPGGERTAHLYVVTSGGRSLAYLFDVTEQKQLELHLQQAQKMQAIGQLAGGVAHDFNNLLTAIQLRLDELLLRHPVGDPSYEGLNEIRQTGVRAADLVRKLLAFSRKQTVKRETLDVGELMSESEVLLRRLLREDVKLVTEYGRDLPSVLADKSQLETAVMNLAVNARDAIRMAGGAGQGEVRIRVARVSQAEARALGCSDARADGAALIEVSDTGPGVPPELATKIFEPFFTTKPVGEGTGMGLATVYGIVEQADGHLTLESKPGHGATFRIFLPIHVPQERALPTPKAEAPVKPARDLSGAGKILFVEDEDAVRGVAARLLRARGYEVIEAADGEEALALAEENAGKIDMLISDVIMPGMDGPSLLKAARAYLGDAPVMFISGYAEAEFSDLLEGETGVSFLPKPIDIKTLAERVKQELRAA